MPDSETPPGPRPARRRLLLAAGFVAAAGFCWWAARIQSPRPSARAPAPEPTASLLVNVYAAGAPARAAQVELLQDGEVRLSEAVDPHGDAQLTDCPRGRFVLVVSAPGFVRHASWVELDRVGLRKQVDLEPGGTLEGHIQDESERAIAGVRVFGRLLGRGDPGPGGPWVAESGADGMFRIDTLPPHARLTLDIESSEAHEASAISELLLPTTAPVVVTLRRTAGLTGRVVAADGTGAAAAQVTLAGSGVWPARTATADRTGEFRFGRVPEGIYELRAELATAVSAPLEGIVISPGNIARVELVLSPGLVLNGRVRDVATGTAIVGAAVDVSEESLSATPRHVVSDAQGVFRLAGLRGLPQRVLVRAAGYVALERWHTPGDDAFTADLLREVIVSGSVQDSSGRPVPNADLEVSGRSETGEAIRMAGPINAVESPSGVDPAASDGLGVTQGPIPHIPLRVPSADRLGDAAIGLAAGFHSDAQGNFHLEGLPPGELVISAFKLGHAPGRSRTLRMRPGSSLDEVLIVLPSGTRVRGQVVDRYNAPSPHVRVELSTADAATRSTVSADDGGFEFEGVRGDCTLVARPSAAPAVRVEVTAAELGRRDVRLVLEKTSERLLGRVVDTHRAGVESASVHLETSGHSFATSAVSSEDGSFEFENLPAPPYNVRVEHPEFSPVALSVRATDASLLVQLEAGSELNLRVSAANSNETIAAARVAITAGDVQRTAKTARDGSAGFRHLPLGNYTLRVESDGYLTAQQSGVLEQLTAAKVAPVVEVALVRVGSASGDVVDRLGATVWNAEVAAGDPPDWTHAARTNHAGHFQLASLPAGEHQLSARSGPLTVTTREPVRIYEAQNSPGVVLRLPGIPEPTDGEPTRARADSKPAADPAVGGPSVVFASRGANVVVERVAPGSAAAHSGLRPGDVLLSANGEPVRSAAQARGMLAKIPGVETSWTLEVRREGALQRLNYLVR